MLLDTTDKPGLLSTITSTIYKAGGNIVASIGYHYDSNARLLLMVDANISGSELENLIEQALEDVDVYVASMGPNAVPLIADFIRDKPGIVAVLENYIEPRDLLDALTRLPRETRVKTYTALSPGTLAAILVEAGRDIVGEVAETLSPRDLAKALETLDADEIADILQTMPEHVQRTVLNNMSPVKRSEVSKLLRYPPRTAGGIMSTSVLVLGKDASVGEALEKLLHGEYYVRDIVVVVDETGRLYGVTPIDDLLRSNPDEKLANLARKPAITVGPYEHQENVAKLMLRYDVKRLVVVDDKGFFLGVIPVEDVAYVVAEEAAEDVLKLGGFIEKPRERYLRTSVLELVKLRLPWLLLIYLIESITANILKSHEDTIERIATAVAFIPLIMATGGNVGSQASSTIIRALALGELTEKSGSDLLYIVFKELATASIIGAVFALVGLGFVYALAGDIWLALSASITLFLVILLSDLIGATLPFIARRLGADPAVLSTPFVATVIDVSVAVIYMAIVSKLVLGL